MHKNSIQGFLFNISPSEKTYESMKICYVIQTINNNAKIKPDVVLNENDFYRILKNNADILFVNNTDETK